MTSHFIFVHCFTCYSWTSNIWTFVKSTYSSTFTMQSTSKISLALSSISSTIHISLVMIPILVVITIIILKFVTSLHIVKLSTSSTSIKSSSPSWRSYLRFPRLTTRFTSNLKSTKDILLNLTCMAFISC